MSFTRSLFLLLGASGIASATVVNIDFNRKLGSGLPATNPGGALDGTYVGLGAAPDAIGNTKWNGFLRNNGDDIIGNSLLNSAGVPTNVGINILDVGNGSSLGDQELGGAPLTFQDLMFDGIVIDSLVAGTLVTKSGTITGLLNGGIYEIYFYGQGSDNNASAVNDGQNSLFGITNGLGGPLIGSAKQTSWDTVPGGNGALTEGIEYVKFTATASATGEIFFYWSNVVSGDPLNPDGFDKVPNSTNNGSRFANLNAMQIVAVPEPSTFLLGALGILGLLVRRR